MQEVTLRLTGVASRAVIIIFEGTSEGDVPALVELSPRASSKSAQQPTSVREKHLCLSYYSQYSHLRPSAIRPHAATQTLDRLRLHDTRQTLTVH